MLAHVWCITGCYYMSNKSALCYACKTNFDNAKEQFFQLGFAHNKVFGRDCV